MGRKRRMQKIDDLDLHGLRHGEVDRIVENRVMVSQLPLTIITGYSDKMKSIVKNVLDRHNFKYVDGIPYNHGCIVVTG